MAEVFLGRPLEDGDDSDLCVIKCILPSLAQNPQYLAMFVNEAQLAAQMHHPGIVEVYDFGEFEGRLYMAMEFVDGLDCWQFARRVYPWGSDHVSLAIWVISRVLEALQYAHDMKDVNSRLLGVVHRDLSPSNIYLSMNGEVKLGDFGIARIDSERYRKVTLIPKGKFGYVAPEQVAGLPIDKRTDIFAAGVVLAELLIGKKMFTGKSQLSVMMEIKDARLDTLEENVDRIDPALLEILRRSMARNPSDRFADAREFQVALETYLDDNGKMVSQADLALQVSRAVELSESESDVSGDPSLDTSASMDVTPAGTADARSGMLATATRPADSAVKTPLAAVDFTGSSSDNDYFGTPITVQSALFEKNQVYKAQLADGREVGPTSYSHIVELICTDQIGPETLISVDGLRFVPASGLPELTRHLPVHTLTWEFDQSNTPDRKGVFVVEAPGEVVLAICLRAESGMLLCKHGRKRKEVYVKEGRPFNISSNGPDDLLGEFLLRNNVIEKNELELALALLPKFNGHMGDTLIALGIITATELFTQITNQMTARFVELLSWKSGFYEFYRDVACRPDVIEVFMDPFAIVSDTLLNIGAEIVSDAALESLGSCTVIPSSQSQELLGRLKLPSQISTVLLDTFNPTKVDEFSQWSGDSAERNELILALFVALETGLWLIEGGAPPWRSMLSQPPTRPS